MVLSFVRMVAAGMTSEPVNVSVFDAMPAKLSKKTLSPTDPTTHPPPRGGYDHGGCFSDKPRTLSPLMCGRNEISFFDW